MKMCTICKQTKGDKCCKFMNLIWLSHTFQAAGLCIALSAQTRYEYLLRHPHNCNLFLWLEIFKVFMSHTESVTLVNFFTSYMFHKASNEHMWVSFWMYDPPKGSFSSQPKPLNKFLCWISTCQVEDTSKRFHEVMGLSGFFRQFKTLFGLKISFFLVNR